MLGWVSGCGGNQYGDIGGGDFLADVSSDVGVLDSSIEDTADDSNVVDIQADQGTANNIHEAICEGIYCSGLGRCIVVSNVARCLCDEGYHSEGDQCVPNLASDPCSGVDCGNGGQCVIIDLDKASIVCACSSGYVDINLSCVKAPDSEGCNLVDIGNGMTVCLQKGSLMGSEDEVYYPELDDAPTATTIPTSVNHRIDYLDAYLNDVGSQGACGTCTAFATTHALEGLLAAAKTAKNLDMSQTHVWSLAGKDLNCTDGASIPEMVGAVTDATFVVPENVWPYACAGLATDCMGKLSAAPGAIDTSVKGYMRGTAPYNVAAGDTSGLERALAKGNNVIYAVPVYDQATSGWSVFGSSTLISTPSATAVWDGNHAILIVGYDRSKQEFLFLNSWSRAWGDGGYGRFSYAFISQFGDGGMAISGYVTRACQSDTDCSCGYCQHSGCGTRQEVFNNLDDNCDGRVDEGVECVNGRMKTCGGIDVGECVAGSQSCASGKWGSCTGMVGPSAEVCDGKDNDCDGAIDEGLKRECGTDVGECVKGKETCDSGFWGDCLGGVDPRQEICDNKDNDCDNSTDEQIDPDESPIVGRCPIYGVCAGGAAVNVCSGGKWSCKFPNSYVGDDKECPSRVTADSSCAFGSNTDPTCKDRKDNDCDGVTDEHSPVTVCKQDPLYGSIGVECFQEPYGRCRTSGGTYVCIDKAEGCGVVVSCEGGIASEEERCDGLDWDCNGLPYDRNDIDGDGFGDCPKYTDCNETSAAINPRGTEACNGKDDDCDGVSDEGVLCPNGQSCVSGSCVCDVSCGALCCGSGQTCCHNSDSTSFVCMPNGSVCGEAPEYASGPTRACFCDSGLQVCGDGFCAPENADCCGRGHPEVGAGWLDDAYCPSDSECRFKYLFWLGSSQCCPFDAPGTNSCDDPVAEILPTVMATCAAD